ncbi:hypothetical protein EJ04DRAFT_31505 [Polyplosphaeria fusca]|uniref:Secreted protein n=1 Tax=Polyplosphaeria fusca TaxID=682080 RepID=A0A9P4QNM6_9PLEO|nr:hypothetical protein EJ04DRAFT_31505 [Polyplosphaeria fusca]
MLCTFLSALPMSSVSAPPPRPVCKSMAGQSALVTQSSQILSTWRSSFSAPCEGTDMPTWSPREQMYDLMWFNWVYLRV